MKQEFVVGVTGHRDLVPECVADIEAQVESFLSDMAEEHHGMAVTVFSPPAEGADMLCASAALRLGLRLI